MGAHVCPLNSGGQVLIYVLDAEDAEALPGLWQEVRAATGVAVEAQRELHRREEWAYGASCGSASTHQELSAIGPNRE